MFLAARYPGTVRLSDRTTASQNKPTDAPKPLWARACILPNGLSWKPRLSPVMLILHRDQHAALIREITSRPRLSTGQQQQRSTTPKPTPSGPLPV